MVRASPVLFSLALTTAVGWVPSCRPAQGPAGTTPPGGVSPARAEGTRPESIWLDTIGSGASQKQRVCARGARDRIATALCDPSLSLRGLADLYRVLDLGAPERRFVAATTHSLGLSARFVSALNPRSFAFVPERAPIPPGRFVAVGFTRGEQLVELVGLDEKTLDYNFYLLRFEQACSATRCTPTDLLTERIERDWTAFTLYSDRDLADTALDCLSCHQPFGPGTRKQLIMRQTASPWLHWGDFRGRYVNRICQEQVEPHPGPWIPGDGLEVLLALEGENGHHAGLPVRELVDAPSGERFSLFLTDAENTIRGTVNTPYPYAQLDFDAANVLCERAAKGTSSLWDGMRRESLARGLPVPYYAHDILEPARRAEVLADRQGFLARNAAADALELAMTFIDPKVEEAVGFVPSSSDSGATILRQACVRCHATNVEPHLKRARFDAERIDRIEPAVAHAIRVRISLPRASPELMPPVRSGYLPPWAISRIEAYLREHCSDPRRGACDG